MLSRIGNAGERLYAALESRVAALSKFGVGDRSRKRCIRYMMMARKSSTFYYFVEFIERPTAQITARIILLTI